MLAKALVTKECDEAIALGTNVAQSAAQLFKAGLETAFFRRAAAAAHEKLGIDIFVLNGVTIDLAELAPDELFDFLQGPVTLEMMERGQGFFRELATLHGVGHPRGSAIMNDAFDLSSEVRFDATSFDYSYSL